MADQLILNPLKKKKNIGVTRAHADQLVKGLIERAHKINREQTDFAFGVFRITIFGSYLTNKARLGDLDIAIKLGPRCHDIEKHCKLCEARSNQAPDHIQATSLGWSSWPQEEVLRALKNRARTFSFHDHRELDRMIQAGLATGRELFHDDAFTPFF